MSHPSGPTRLPDHAALLTACGDDPFVRWHVDPGTVAEGGAWSLGTAVAFVRRGPSGRRSLTVLAGSRRADAEALVAAVLEQRRAGRTAAYSLTVPQGLPVPLDVPGMDVPGHDWNWVAATEVPPPGPGEAAVVGVDDGHPALRDLLDAASPRYSLVPGTVPGSQWVGLWDEAVAGRLLACAARDGGVRGVPHLASIAVRPDRRGRGLGGTVTAALTRRLLARGAPAVSLGYYADNLPARRMYERIGFGRRHEWTSRVLPPV